MEYETAAEWNKELALARYEIIKFWNQFKGTKKEYLEKFKKRQLQDILPEIYEKIKKLSESTLNNWLRRYEKDGLSGLLSRHGRSGARYTVEQKDFIIECIAKNPRVRPARVFEYFNNRFEIKTSRRSIERFMKRWKDENYQVYNYLVNPIKWRSKYQVSLGRADEGIDHFCQRWELDSTPADIVCADGKRYVCVGAIDVYSRKALVLLSEVSKSSAIAGLLRHGMIKWGVPKSIVKDHGKDYASKHIEAICADFGIKTPFIPPYRPDLKPHIERFWQTLAYGLFEELPGFTGHDVAQAQEIRAREKFAKQFLKHGETVKSALTKEELQEAIDRWIARYEQKIHSGINARPAERATGMVSRIGDEKILNLLLAPRGEGTVQKKGISFQGGLYQAAELYDHIHRRIQIRQDITDASRIYCFDKKGKFLFIAVDKALTGYTPEERDQARKAQNRMIRRKAEAISQLNKTSENSMLELLKKPMQGQVLSLSRRKEAEISAAKEALKGIEARNEIENREEPVTEMPDDEGLFYESDSQLRDYESIREKLRQGKPIIDREQKVKEDVENNPRLSELFKIAEGGGK